MSNTTKLSILVLTNDNHMFIVFIRSLITIVLHDDYDALITILYMTHMMEDKQKHQKL